jgi:hypothetical protein
MRIICSRSSESSSKLLMLVIENTSRKPWPCFMYNSRIAVNCSVPAVSRLFESVTSLMSGKCTGSHLEYALPSLDKVSWEAQNVTV